MKFFAWLRHWIRTAIAASSKKDFYRRLDDRKIGEGVGHLALLTVFLWVIPFLVVFFIAVRGMIQSLDEGLRTHVPAAAVFEMKGGRFTNNLDAPLTIPFEGDTAILINASNTQEILPPYRPSISVSILPDRIVQRVDDHETTERTFKGAPDFKFTREDVLGGIDRWAPVALFFGALIATAAVFAAMWAGFLISAAAHAAVLWIALKLAKRSWPWKRAFVAAAYAATLPLVLNALLAAAGLHRLEAVPNILYWLILIWIAYDAYKRNAPVPGKGVTDEPGSKESVGRPSGGP